MIRYECLELLAAKMSDQLVVTSQSGQRIEWSHLSKHEGNLLVGMMGCAIGVATGLALALPHRKVIALIPTAAFCCRCSILRRWETFGRRIWSFTFSTMAFTAAAGSVIRPRLPGNTDLAAMARGAGIKNAQTIRDFEEFNKHGIGALSRNELSFLVCKVEESLLHREISRPNTDLAENKYTFVRYLERTEEKTIPFVGRG